MPYLVASAAIVVARVVGGRSARRRVPIRGPTASRSACGSAGGRVQRFPVTAARVGVAVGLGFRGVVRGVGEPFPRAAPPACGGPGAARVGERAAQGHSGFATEGAAAIFGPPAARCHALLVFRSMPLAAHVSRTGTCGEKAAANAQ